MIPDLLTRPQLEIINRRTLKYPLHAAEKDYFLALVLLIITRSSVGPKIVFKGGTAIYHCYLDQYRFSEDLDFSSITPDFTPSVIRNIIEEIPFFSVKKEMSTDKSIKISRLQYIGPLQHSNSLKVEIDIFQNVFLPSQTRKYNNVWGIDFDVNVMDVREIGAEKIRTMSDRARYRDFYDFYWLAVQNNFDLPDILSILSHKEIRQPVTKSKILRNWDLVSAQKAMEYHRIFYSRNVDESLIKGLIESLPFYEISSGADPN